MIGVTRTGPTAASPVVFLHGGVINRQMWLPVMEILESSYDCVAIDLPSHGALRGVSFSVQSSRERVEQVLDVLGLEHVALVGLSLGGYVALDFAYMWPDRVDGMVLSGATVNYTGWDAISTRMYGWAFPAAARLAEKTFIKKLESDFEPHHAQAILDAGLSMRGGAQSLRRLPGIDYAARIEGFDKPLVVANGERDTPNRDGEVRFSKLHPHAKLMVIPDAGHACAIQQPAAFAAAVEDLMSEIIVR